MNPVYAVFLINDGTNTVRIDCQKVVRSISNNVTFIEKPIKPSSQGSTSPTTVTLDLKRISYNINVNGYLIDDSAESGDSCETKTTKIINMIDQKKGPFTVTYRGTSLGANWFLTKVDIDDSQDSEPSGDAGGGSFGGLTPSRTSTVKKFAISLSIRRGTGR